MTDNSLKQTFVKEKPFSILRKISEDGDWWASKIAMKTETSDIHARKVIPKLQGKGLVKVHSNSDSKKNLITLTDKGRKLVQAFNRLDEKFNEVEQE